MACKNTCKLCKRLIISQSITFSSGILIINIPAGTYQDDGKYCIVIAQAIPTTATINAPVVVTIGTGTVQYPLMNRDCTQVTACTVKTRTKYATRVNTSTTSGTFNLLDKCSTCGTTTLSSINGTTPVVSGVVNYAQ